MTCITEANTKAEGVVFKHCPVRRLYVHFLHKPNLSY